MTVLLVGATRVVGGIRRSNLGFVGPSCSQTVRNVIKWFAVCRARQKPQLIKLQASVRLMYWKLTMPKANSTSAQYPAGRWLGVKRKFQAQTKSPGCNRSTGYIPVVRSFSSGRSIVVEMKTTPHFWVQGSVNTHESDSWQIPSSQNWKTEQPDHRHRDAQSNIKSVDNDLVTEVRLPRASDFT